MADLPAATMSPSETHQQGSWLEYPTEAFDYYRRHGVSHVFWRVHIDKTHAWHMETLARLAAADPELLVATPHRRIDLDDESDVAAATEWWRQLTERGGEGMVVKPADFIARDPKGLLQPALKCRGREYLRIIYGPEYDLPKHIERLRQRGLGAKRSLAMREFCLGVESLQRFVNREPLRRVHECVFGVLALESEPVDPRL